MMQASHYPKVKLMGQRVRKPLGILPSILKFLLKSTRQPPLLSKPTPRLPRMRASNLPKTLLLTQTNPARLILLPPMRDKQMQKALPPTPGSSPRDNPKRSKNHLKRLPTLPKPRATLK
jgi:hypothetical protein